MVEDTFMLKHVFPSNDPINRPGSYERAKNLVHEIMKKYVDLMLKYNMSCKVPFEGNGGIERYVELIREYYFKDGFTAYALYYEPTGSGYDGTNTNVNLPLMKEYIRALNIYQDASLAMQLGSCYQRIGELEKAMDSYEFALDLDPELTEARTKLATALVADGRYSMGLKHMPWVVVSGILCLTERQTTGILLPLQVRMR